MAPLHPGFPDRNGVSVLQSLHWCGMWCAPRQSSVGPMPYEVQGIGVLAGGVSACCALCIKNPNINGRITRKTGTEGWALTYVTSITLADTRPTGGSFTGPCRVRLCLRKAENGQRWCPSHLLERYRLESGPGVTSMVADLTSASTRAVVLKKPVGKMYYNEED